MNNFLNVFLNIFENFIVGLADAWYKLSTPLFEFNGQTISMIELLSWPLLGALFVVLLIKLFL